MKKFMEWVEAGSLEAIDNYGTRRTIKEYFQGIMFLSLTAPLAVFRLIIEPLHLVIGVLAMGGYWGIVQLLQFSSGI